ncbi:GNAT family N-acetyltransferase [Deinococcus hohokamensis]|uniref:GNAT family N-acetyltransferase n=1 Tax=Deinococcus hohokamensis TaxID=309883 RepID=A0ABV9I7G5_9DEIO
MTVLPQVAHAEAQAHARYGQPGAVARFGPLVAVHASPGSVLNAAWHGGPDLPTEADLDALEAFSLQHNQPASLHLLSHAAPELLDLLAARGYRLRSSPHLYTHSLRSLPPRPSLDIREESDPEAWAHWSAEGFGGGLEIMQAVARAPGTALYAVWQGSEVAATGAMSLCAGVAALHGASTRPAFRGQGAQSALLAWRLHQAAAQEAKFASVFVTPGTSSERNIVRAGFVLGGLRLTFRQGEA